MYPSIATMAPVDASLNGTATASLITITSAEVTGRLTPNATQRWVSL